MEQSSDKLPDVDGLRVQLVRELLEKGLREKFKLCSLFTGNKEALEDGIKLKQLLKENESRIWGINDPPLNNDQLEIIFPTQKGKRSVELRDFDVSLLYAFILEFCELTDDDKAKLYELKRVRNNIQHSGIEIDPQIIEKAKHSLEYLGFKAEIEEIDTLNLAPEKLKRLSDRIRNAKELATRVQCESKTAEGEKSKADNLENRLGGITYKLLPRIRTFIGRDQEIKEVHQKLSNLSKEQVALVLTGLTGVGKSEVTRQYCNDYQKSYQENVVWINGESEGGIEQAFIDAVMYNKLAVQNHLKENINLEKAKQCFYQYFSKRKLLLVFDNVNKVTSINRYLPPHDMKMNVKPCILITSYISQWDNSKYNVLYLGPFNLEDGRAFLDKHVPEKLCGIEEGVKNGLIDVVGSYPLSLQHAIGYSMTNQVTFSDFTDIYKRKAEYLMAKSFTNNFGSGPALKPYYDVITKLKREGNSELGEKLMNFIAHLDPHGVEKGFLCDIIEGDLKDVEVGLLLMKKYNLTYEPSEELPFEDQLVQMHIPVGVTLRHRQCFQEKASEKYFRDLLSAMFDHVKSDTKEYWIRQFWYIFNRTNLQKQFYKLLDVHVQSLLLQVFRKFHSFTKLDEIMEGLIKFHGEDMRHPNASSAWDVRAKCMKALGSDEKAKEYEDIFNTLSE